MPCRSIAALLASMVLTCFQPGNAQKSDPGHEIALDLQAGDYAGATLLLKRALKQAPNDARLWTFNGLAQVKLNHAAVALQSFERALAIAPDYLPALESAAQLTYETDAARAVPLLNRILALRPHDPTSHSMLAELAFKRGDCEAARDHYTQSLPDGGSEIAGLQEFGACQINQKRINEALPVFKTLTELQPNSQQALYAFAVVQFLTGRYSEVIQTLTPALGEQPGADMLELLAEAKEFSGDATSAAALLRQAIATDPQAAEYYTAFAYLCLAHGDFQEGIDVLNNGLKLLPRAAPLYVARGLLFSELGKFDEGETDFQTASRLDPNVELGSAAQGLAELQHNDLPRAEQTARARLQLNPKDAFLHYLLAEVLTKKGPGPPSAEFSEALQSAETAVKLKPDLILARNLLARLYLQAGRTSDSIEQSRAVFRANPNDQTALYHLILALRKGNRTDELPALLTQLARLKQQSRKQDNIEQHYQSLAPTQ